MPTSRELRTIIASACATGLACASAAAAEEVPVADFEQPTYGQWTTEGEAFGEGPAAGTLPHQMPVTGYTGDRLANSYHGGDDATGTLTSPPFEIRHRYLRFLIGGGQRPGETGVRLLLDREPVRTATGPMPPGGRSEELVWAEWDVADLIGQSVRLEIIDQAKGHWGHITVDEIVQTDEPLPPIARDVERVFEQEGRYLHLPVSHNAAERRMSVLVDGEAQRVFDIQLALDEPDFWVTLDLKAFADAAITVRVDELPGHVRALQALQRSDTRREGEADYRETHRPQFHFTARRGWLNDPNGMVYHEGLWHLYYQHNPFGWNWGNMHWGHAVSRDLVHWEEMPLAVHPREYGDWAFSGSAVVDQHNTSGFGTADEPPLIAAFTSTGRGECILYSNDGGMTWEEYEGNPVVKHVGRDPRLLWHEASGRWVMALYTEAEDKQWIAFYTSPDLKEWTYRSRIEGFYECPDLVELPVEGLEGQTRWVLYGADGGYLLGEFDGERFTPTIAEKRYVWYGSFYAAQTFTSAPDNRCIQIGWARDVTFPDMPFNQQMTVPVELSLRKTPDAGIRLHARPVPELETLREKAQQVSSVMLADGENVPLGEGELLDIEATLIPGSARTLGLRVRGIEITYDPAARRLTCGNVQAPLIAGDDKLTLRVLVDRGSVEIFAEDGRVALSVPARPDSDDRSITAFAHGGKAQVEQATIHEMTSAWQTAGSATP